MDTQKKQIDPKEKQQIVVHSKVGKINVQGVKKSVVSIKTHGGRKYKTRFGQVEVSPGRMRVDVHPVDPVMVETFSIIRPNIPFEKWSLVDVLPVVGAVKQGFTMVEGENVRDAMGLPKTDFFRVVGLSTRTAQRRQKDEKVLDVVSSDRIWRLANILAIATLVFKDREKARSWLHRSQPGLSGERPVDLLETEKGAGAVEDLLNAIRYGNYV